MDQALLLGPLNDAQRLRLVDQPTHLPIGHEDGPLTEGQAVVVGCTADQGTDPRKGLPLDLGQCLLFGKG